MFPFTGDAGEATITKSRSVVAGFKWTGSDTDEVKGGTLG